MALVSIGWLDVPTRLTADAGTFTIDAADEMAWSLIPIRSAGNIRYIHFRTGTVTTGATVDVRIETLDTSGQPSGTLWGVTTNGSQVIADANDNTFFRTQLTADAVVAAGDVIAVMVKNPSASAGNMLIATGVGSTSALPHAGGPLATNKSTSPSFFGLEYDDNSFALMPGYQFGAMTSPTYNTGTNPDEIALYFTPLVKMRVCGWWWHGFTNSGADYRLNLYASGNDTPLLTKSIDGDAKTATTGVASGFFTATQELTVGTVYRLGLLPTTAASIFPRYVTVNSSHLGLLNGSGLLSSAYYSVRNRSGTADPDAAAWTETTSLRPIMGLIVDQLDNGAGGGGLMTHPGLSGGFRG